MSSFSVLIGLFFITNRPLGHIPLLCIVITFIRYIWIIYKILYCGYELMIKMLFHLMCFGFLFNLILPFLPFLKHNINRLGFELLYIHY
jgi:hypothetical protein